MKLTKKVDTDFLKGVIEYELTSYNEKIKQSINLVANVKPEKKLDDEGNDTGEVDSYVVVESHSKIALDYFELVKKNVSKVDVEIISGEYSGTKLSTIEDLYQFKEGIQIGTSIANSLVGGVQLGNAPKS